ncbi:hypothetical protein [Pseudomonas sp. TE3610]
MVEDPLCIVFVPALVAVLTAAEKHKGSALTESEVCDLRDKGACIRLPASVARDMESARGYPDIVAEDCWQEWQRVRQA